jgi:maltooligosyltrehalose trehalohydrolase
MRFARRLPIGAEVADGATHFRVWAPQAQRVDVVFEGDGAQNAIALDAEKDGYFSGVAANAMTGTRYRFRLNGADQLYPDPASRFQPEGPHGPSELVDFQQFTWTDSAWRGVPRDGQVVYELHIGTFTPQGTWQAALEQLPKLAELGVTVLEIMPVADFPGRFGWGYDGVNLFAPTRLYGAPDDFRRFVDRAHALGLGVVLDVVYNHFGPDGNYLRSFSEDYFTDRYKNEWGEAINFDGPNSLPVREFFLANAAYWIDEYHLDGLRLDATQQIFDASADNIMAALARRVRQAGGQRATWIVAENEPQHAKLARHESQGGYGLDALWNDDFHHSAMVALTGKNPAYYTDYHGDAQEFISALKWGFLYQGQRYAWQKKRRGLPCLDLAPAQLVVFLQNHDQIANSGRGLRCHALTSPGRYKALTALFLLGPNTPMLFQGQEFASSKPFYYFADHKPELAALVQSGRQEFLAQFPSLALPDMQAELAAPHEPETFAKCRLDWSERERHAELLALHRALLELRRDDPVFRFSRRRGMDGAVLSASAFVLRFFGDAAGDRLIVVNLGRDCQITPAPEPLLAPPADCAWELAWSSDDVKYGGCGTPPLETDAGWFLPGEATVVLRPKVAGTLRVP